MTTFIIRFASLLAIILLAASAYLYCIQNDGVEQTLLLTAEKDIGEVSTYTKTLVNFTITNPSKRTRRIISGTGTCNVQGCLTPLVEGQILVEAGATHEYTCELTLRKIGTFEIPITVYLEDNGLRTITLTAQGVAIAPEVPLAKSNPSVQ